MSDSEDRTAWQCPYFRVDVEHREGPDGTRRAWYTARRPNPNTVHILALTEDNMVPLLRQYRVPVGGWVWELPAGVCDVEGEAIADAAARELLEETGYRCKEIHGLFSGTVSPGLTDEMYHAFLAVDLEKVHDGGGTGSEQIEVHMAPFHELTTFLLEKANNGELVDSKIFAHVVLAIRKLSGIQAAQFTAKLEKKKNKDA